MRHILTRMALAVALGLLVISCPVLAKASASSEDSDSSGSSDQTTSSNEDGGGTSHRELTTNSEERFQEAIKAHRGKLDATRVKVCDLHEAQINKITSRIANRGQKRLDLFSTIATRVENFYTKQGKVVSNYDTLVADLDAKKTAAQDAVTKVKNDKADFKCDGSDPKGVALGFKDDVSAEIKALHAYRLSIKNLIVAVKTAQGGQ